MCRVRRHASIAAVTHQDNDTSRADSAFDSLPLADAQLRNLEQLGYRQMTEIQTLSLPHALAGGDVIAQAKTGSGKTVAFGLALLNNLNSKSFAPQALVLCPTRELAQQVAAELRALARCMANIKVITLCGGQSIGPQIGSLAHGAHVIVGTPGRVHDHLRKGTLSLDRVNTLVLDEADRMLEMGFVETIEQIAASTPAQRQTLLFSATYPEGIEALSARFQSAPQRVTATEQHSETSISQSFYDCGRGQRQSALEQLLLQHQPAAAIIFCNTRRSVRETCSALRSAGLFALGLHGDMEQRERDQVLAQFRHASCRLLVATDVAARGLDIEALPAVVNLELPREAAVYVHRIGRVGRAGEQGIALSLVTASEQYKLDEIAQLTGLAIATKTLDLDALPRIDDTKDHDEDLSCAHSDWPPPEFKTLCLAGGRKEKLRPGDILGALTRSVGLSAAAVGKITVMEHAAYVAVRREHSSDALRGLREGGIKGRRIKVRAL